MTSVKITFDYEITASTKTDEFDPNDFAGCSSKAAVEDKLIAEADEMVEFGSFISERSQLDELWRQVEEIRKGEGE